MTNFKVVLTLASLVFIFSGAEAKALKGETSAALSDTRLFICNVSYPKADPNDPANISIMLDTWQIFLENHEIQIIDVLTGTVTYKDGLSFETNTLTVVGGSELISIRDDENELVAEINVEYKTKINSKGNPSISFKSAKLLLPNSPKHYGKKNFHSCKLYKQQ